jgi:glutamate/tyrosine decarboxylase-like PLP-dependent enzyme
MSDYPYADRFPVVRGFPDEGRAEDEILSELRTIAALEDARWETGRCSGTFYCGDHEHYAFMNEAFALFSHMNVLQRDLCPSATKFEGEIIAMALDLMHGADVTDAEPAGMVTTGGTASILHAVLAYRDAARSTRRIERPNLVKPETAHPAFDKAAHLTGVEVRTVPVDPETTQADVDAVRAAIDDSTVVVVASAGNYGYGTIDPIGALAEVAQTRGAGLHVDACLGGFILPFGEALGYPIPPFDFRIPGVTSISADTHKYAYGLKGTSVLLFRDRALRNAQYFFHTDWSGGKYCSPGIDGSRSNGLLAATWAGMVRLGRRGYMEYARRIFATAFAMQDVVRSHPELRILGNPTFCFAFTSGDFDIYHVNDFLQSRGWRLNGLQYPNAIHMAVTRPQTLPGVVDAFRDDLAAAVDYARAHRDERPRSGAIYGGIPGGMTVEANELIRAVMAEMMDRHQSLPPRPPG